MLAVVRPVDAGRVEVLVTEVGLAVRVAREPFRMRVVDLLAGAIGVHAREDHDAVLPRRLREVAEEVAPPEQLGSGGATEDSPRGGAH